MVKKFRIKPVIVEAVQFKGNDTEIMEFCPTAFDPENSKPLLLIPIGCRNLVVTINDWIVKNEFGEYTIYKPELFNEIYELIK